jgi:hypothetical protein
MALWSLAQLGHQDEATFRAAARAAQRHVSGCAPAFIRLVASALGTAGRQEPLLLLALVGEARGRLRQLPPDVVSSLSAAPLAGRAGLRLAPAPRPARCAPPPSAELCGLAQQQRLLVQGAGGGGKADRLLLTGCGAA